MSPKILTHARAWIDEVVTINEYNMAPFGLPHIQLVRLLFSAGTVARIVFFSQFQPKFSKPNGAYFLHKTAHAMFIITSYGLSHSLVRSWQLVLYFLIYYLYM